MAKEEAGVQPSNNHYWDPASEDCHVDDDGDDHISMVIRTMIVVMIMMMMTMLVLKHGHDQGRGGGGQPARTYSQELAPFTLSNLFSNYFYTFRTTRS